MSINNPIKEANALYRAGAYRKALNCYLEISSRYGWATLLRANIALCHKRLGLASEDGLNTIYGSESPEIIVSLTTINSRLSYVPQVVNSLLNQTLRPIRIDLNISREPYLLDEGIAEDAPILLELMRDPLVSVNWVPNIGSYRKIWHVLEDHFSKEEAHDQLFVTVDDDTLYPEYFLEHLYKNFLQHDCIIAFRGRHIEMEGKNIAPYDLWSWGKNHPSLNNLPTGKDGVLYSTKFFTKDFLDLTMAKRLAPTADDLWIKWHCGLNGVPAVILNPVACESDYKSFPLISYCNTYRQNSLYNVHNSTGSLNKNDLATKELEEHFNMVRGYNLASLIRCIDADNKQTSWKGLGGFLVNQSCRLPLLLFIEQSSVGASKAKLDTMVWQEKSNYRYVIATDSILEIDSDFSIPSYSKGIVLLEGVAYTPEIADTIIALIDELNKQNTLRYTFTLTAFASDTLSLPRVEFWLPGNQEQVCELDGRAINKNCNHLAKLKQLRHLLEKQKSVNNSSISFVVSQKQLRDMPTQGPSLFKKKYLSNCHVLNLAHRTDRLSRVNKVFSTMDIEVNRVDAVFGKESPICHKILKEVAINYDKLSCSELAPFTMEITMYQDYSSEIARNTHFAKKQGKLLSLGSLGYLLSYRKALVQGLCGATADNDYITVFDDDVLLHSEWDNILDKVFWQLPENPAVIMLGAIQYHWGPGINWFSKNLYCCNGTSIASHATVIHKDYAQFLIDEIEKFTLPFDIGALHYLKSSLFSRSFVIYPNILIQETSESDIADTKNQSVIGQQKDNMYKWELAKYKVGRA